MNSRNRKLFVIISLVFLTAIVVTPRLSSGQNGVGGKTVRRPDLGCACLAVTESEPTSTQKTSRKLSAEECKKKGDVATVYNGSEVDKKAVILEQPKPETTPFERAAGRVILKAILCPNGSVGRVGIVVGASKQLNESAIEAARNIKFEAAIKDGIRVAQYLQLEYTFTADALEGL